MKNRIITFLPTYNCRGYAYSVFDCANRAYLDCAYLKLSTGIVDEDIDQLVDFLHTTLPAIMKIYDPYYLVLPKFELDKLLIERKEFCWWQDKRNIAWHTAATTLLKTLYPSYPLWIDPHVAWKRKKCVKSTYRSMKSYYPTHPDYQMVMDKIRRQTPQMPYNMRARVTALSNYYIENIHIRLPDSIKFEKIKSI